MIPKPTVPVPSEAGRRIYFERLAATLLAEGVPGDRIGEIVAELDDHVTQTGVDPVDELGPVGEVAGALAGAVKDRHPWQTLVGDTLMGVAAGVAIATAGALVFGREPGVDVVVGLWFAAYMAVFTTGIALLRRYGSGSMVGKSRFELPAWKGLVPVMVAVAVVNLTTQNWEWRTSAATAMIVLAVALPATVLLAIWSIRRSKITIPGRARHLRRLEWGPFGRRRRVDEDR
jgi:hypothetical protein